MSSIGPYTLSSLHENGPPIQRAGQWQQETPAVRMTSGGLMADCPRCGGATKIAICRSNLNGNAGKHMAAHPMCRWWYFWTAQPSITSPVLPRSPPIPPMSQMSCNNSEASSSDISTAKKSRRKGPKCGGSFCRRPSALACGRDPQMCRQHCSLAGGCGFHPAIEPSSSGFTIDDTEDVIYSETPENYWSVPDMDNVPRNDDDDLRRLRQVLKNSLATLPDDARRRSEAEATELLGTEVLSSAGPECPSLQDLLQLGPQEPIASPPRAPPTAEHLRTPHTQPTHDLSPLSQDAVLLRPPQTQKQRNAGKITDQLPPIWQANIEAQLEQQEDNRQILERRRIPIPVHVPSYRGRESWPARMYTIDMITGLTQMNDPSFSVRYNHHARFKMIFGVDYVPATYFKHRNLWREAIPSILDEFKAAGRTEEGLWKRCTAAHRIEVQ